MDVGCSPSCVDAITQSWGQLSERCYNFNAYEGCLYIDGYRLPAERYMEYSAQPGVQRSQLLMRRANAVYMYV